MSNTGRLHIPRSGPVQTGYETKSEMPPQDIDVTLKKWELDFLIQLLEKVVSTTEAQFGGTVMLAGPHTSVVQWDHDKNEQVHPNYQLVPERKSC